MRALLLALVGCGRLGFGDGTPDGGPIDAPPLPGELVCSARVLDIAPPGATADLAIARAGTGFTAMWVDGVRSVQALELDSGFRGAQIEVLPGPVDSIGGLAITPLATLFATQTGPDQTLWSAQPLSAPALKRAEPSVLAHDPTIVDVDSGTPRAWVRGVPAGQPPGLIASYISDGGEVRLDQLIPTGGAVIAAASADNFGHGHITWSEDVGGTPRCFQNDLLFDQAAAPRTNDGGILISDSCSAPRITSGPRGSDAIFNVWARAGGEIDLLYRGSVVDLFRVLSPSGRAPKVAFDGTVFWVVWIDQAPSGDVLRIAQVSEGGTNTAVDLPGWIPASDESFELVRRGNIVYLAILGAGTLSFLETCM